MTTDRPNAQRDIQADAALEGMHEQPEDISNKARGHKANLSNPNTSEQSKQNSKKELEALGGEKAFYGKQEAGSVFVIGGCGLLGNHIVQSLLSSNSATHITVFDITTNHNRVEDPRARYVNGVITSRADLHVALQACNADTIIHTASPDPLTTAPEILERVNVQGTQNVISCAMDLGINVLVYTSSSDVVQNGYENMLGLDESVPVAESPVNGSVYGRTKKMGEKLVLEVNGRRGLRTVALRPCTLFGECDRLMTRHTVEMARDGRVKYCIGSGTNLYGYVYAGNAADAHVLAAKKLWREARSATPVREDEQVSGEIFFVTNDEPWPFWDFVICVAREIGKPVEEKDVWHIPLSVMCFFVGLVEWVTWVVTLGGRPGLTVNMVRYTVQTRTFDISKAKKRLGYQPKVGIEEGIKRAVQWQLSGIVREKESGIELYGIGILK
ncbi:NAD(P)-binding protein [Sporormia fimetaria CBS 119925]|uniref:NAD(P)-binding protein n=1 Tax=Sporormia fimetaria CBS 119925 TaxID=1340428 RepID=A0A6A6V2B4_9PLEO|nr:NAD(P)-binding protein [Sporormia fimetaria CBS 119925]